MRVGLFFIYVWVSFHMCVRIFINMRANKAWVLQAIDLHSLLCRSLFICVLGPFFHLRVFICVWLSFYLYVCGFLFTCVWVFFLIRVGVFIRVWESFAYMCGSLFASLIPLPNSTVWFSFILVGCYAQHIFWCAIGKLTHWLCVLNVHTQRICHWVSQFMKWMNRFLYYNLVRFPFRCVRIPKQIQIETTIQI